MKNFVVIAHDELKSKLVDFLKEKEDWLKVRTAKLVATGRTGELLETEGVSNIEHLSPGKSGGYIEISNMIANGQIDLVIFFRDYKVNQPHHVDIQNLLDACDKLNIPVATNPASAELLILGLIKKEATDRIKKNISE